MTFSTPVRAAALAAAVAFFSAPLALAETIVTRETERYFYSDGVMTRYDGQYEHTYFFDPEKNSLRRTRVYDYQNKLVTPADTVYYIQRQLNSHPSNAANLGLKSVIRAIGRPGADTVEILVIDDDSVDALTSTGSTLIASHAERLK